MFVSFVWILGLLSLILLVVLQFYVISLISDFEVKGMNPLESSVSLNKTTKPTIYVFAVTVLTTFVDFGHLWEVFILQIGAGAYFFSCLNDKTQWFEPRYLYRDLSKIKIRHCVLLMTSMISALCSFFVLILK